MEFRETNLILITNIQIDVMLLVKNRLQTKVTQMIYSEFSKLLSIYHPTNCKVTLLVDVNQAVSALSLNVFKNIQICVGISICSLHYHFETKHWL